MKNRYSDREQSWWQHLSASCKVFFVLVIGCLAAVAGVGYFLNTANPAKSGQFIMAFCLFVVAIIGLGAIVVCTVNAISSENRSAQTLAQAQEMYHQAEEINAQTRQMIKEESERRRAEDDYLEHPDLDGKWEDEAEQLDHKQQTADKQNREEEPLRELTPDELEQIKEALDNFDYEQDRNDVLERAYARQARKAGALTGDDTRSKVVAILTRIHTGEIDVKMVKAHLRGKTTEEAATPEENTGEQPKKPAALPAPQPQLLLEQKPDSPESLEQPSAEEEEYPSIAEQAAYLNVKPAELNFYLRGRAHWSMIPKSDLRKLRQIAQMRA